MHSTQIFLLLWLSSLNALEPNNATANAVIAVDSIETLQKIGRHPEYPLSGMYQITKDIDASQTREWNRGEGFLPLGSTDMPFTGTLSGENYAISGLLIDAPDKTEIGLFNCIGKEAKVHNLHLKNAMITGASYCGGFAAENRGEIRDCSVHGLATGKSHVGLLAGVNYGSLTNCRTSGIVSGLEYVGGLAGSNQDKGKLTDCESACMVHASELGGGLTGANLHGELVDCTVKTKLTVSECGGGIAGTNFGIVVRCHATGFVSGRHHTGGIVGVNYGVVMISRAACPVSGDNTVGGVAGFAGNGLIIGCQSTGQITGNTHVGGLIGTADDAFALRACSASGKVVGKNCVGGLVGTSMVNSIGFLPVY